MGSAPGGSVRLAAVVGLAMAEVRFGAIRALVWGASIVRRQVSVGGIVRRAVGLVGLLPSG